MKRIVAIIASLAVMATTAVSAFAASGGDDVETIMSAGLDTLKADTLKIVLIALPVGLAIFAAFFGIRKGIALLRGIAK